MYSHPHFTINQPHTHHHIHTLTHRCTLTLTHSQSHPHSHTITHTHSPHFCFSVKSLMSLRQRAVRRALLPSPMATDNQTTPIQYLQGFKLIKSKHRQKDSNFYRGCTLDICNFYPMRAQQFTSFCLLTYQKKKEMT